MHALCTREPWSLGSKPRSNELRLAEEKPRFAGCVLVAVGGVNRVSLLRFGVELPHRALRGLLGIRCTDCRAERGNSLTLFEHHRHARPRGHERNEWRVERPLAMNGIKLLGLGLRKMRHARRADAKSLLLEVCDDFPCLIAAE